MSSLNLVRGFTYFDTNEFRVRGLNFPNDQRFNFLNQPEWPKGLSFFNKTPNSMSVAMTLATVQARELRYERPTTYPLPAIAIVECGSDIFELVKTGMVGVNRTDKGLDVVHITSIPQAKGFEELVIEEKYLRPNWVSKMNVQLGSPFGGEIKLLDIHNFFNVELRGGSVARKR